MSVARGALGQPIIVTELKQTCNSCPSQWEGRLADGGYIYVRYRGGVLRIGTGSSDADAVAAAMDMDGHRSVVCAQLGDSLDGTLSYQRLRLLCRELIDWPY